MPARKSGAGRTEKRLSVRPRELLKARGLRSREFLKKAAREVLNEQGYPSLRVQDVAARAGVATGLFYRYFHDLREIVGELAEDFFAELHASAAQPVKAAHPYAWIVATLRNVTTKFAANPGMLACLFGLAGDYEEFDEIWKRNAHRWNLEVARFLTRDAGYDRARARRAAFMLGAMTEGVIYQALIRHTADLVQLAGRPDELADALAVMWYRAIFLEDPPRAQLRASGQRLIAPPQRRRKT
ncbi:MAG: TetR/AcrR family transcriptional regulator [Steroidobacteraceae bacterium]